MEHRGKKNGRHVLRLDSENLFYFPLTFCRLGRSSQAWVLEQGGGAHLRVACTRGLAPATHLHQ